MDQYADDLAELIEHLDVKEITMVGHSTDGGEVARYIGRHGNKRVKKAVLISSAPDHVEERQQSRRTANGCVRRPPRRCCW